MSPASRLDLPELVVHADAGRARLALRDTPGGPLVPMARVHARPGESLAGELAHRIETALASGRAGHVRVHAPPDLAHAIHARLASTTARAWVDLEPLAYEPDGPP